MRHDFIRETRTAGTPFRTLNALYFFHRHIRCLTRNSGTQNPKRKRLERGRMNTCRRRRWRMLSRAWARKGKARATESSKQKAKERKRSGPIFPKWPDEMSPSFPWVYRDEMDEGSGRRNGSAERARSEAQAAHHEQSGATVAAKLQRRRRTSQMAGALSDWHFHS